MNRHKLSFESLECRATPATFGNPWPDAAHMTLSFTPDQAQVGDAPSELFAVLDAQMDRQEWQTAILRAFQTWAVHADINIGLVADSEGLPLGFASAPQGSEHFGDIRIATYPLASDVVAVSSPFDALAGTWSGDVKLNPAYDYRSDAHDLFTVMLHEAGHVFGIGHNADANSPLHETYLGVRADLTLDDIAHLQAMYGTRSQDSFDAKASNQTSATATRLNPSLDFIQADLTSLNDVDVYQFSPQGNQRDVAVRLVTSGFSLLTARLSVFSQDGTLLGSTVGLQPGSSDLEIVLRDLSPSKSYYIQVEKAADDVFGIGGYYLQVQPVSGTRTENSPEFVDYPTDGQEADAGTQGHGNNGNGGQGNNQGNGGQGGGNGSQAVNLQARTNRTDSRFDYVYRAVIDSNEDVDLYRFKSPQPKEGPTNLVFSVWAVDDGLQPLVTLRDEFGNVIPVELLVRDQGTFTFQVRNVASNAQFTAEVTSATDSTAVGRYMLGIDFTENSYPVETLVESHVFDAAADAEHGVLHANQSQMLHLIGTAQGSGLSVQIVDARMQEVLTWFIPAGETRTTDVHLVMGDYLVTFTPSDPSAEMTFSLQGLALTDPIGPHPVDTTTTPAGSAPFWWETGYQSFLGGGSQGGTSEPPSTPGDSTPSEPPASTSGNSGSSSSSTSTPGGSSGSGGAPGSSTPGGSEIVTNLPSNPSTSTDGGSSSDSGGSSTGTVSGNGTSLPSGSGTSGQGSSLGSGTPVAHSSSADDVATTGSPGSSSSSGSSITSGSGTIILTSGGLTPARSNSSNASNPSTPGTIVGPIASGGSGRSASDGGSSEDLQTAVSDSLVLTSTFLKSNLPASPADSGRDLQQLTFTLTRDAKGAIVASGGASALAPVQDADHQVLVDRVFSTQYLASRLVNQSPGILSEPVDMVGRLLSRLAGPDSSAGHSPSSLKEEIARLATRDAGRGMLSQIEAVFRDVKWTQPSSNSSSLITTADCYALLHLCCLVLAQPAPPTDKRQLIP